MGSCASSHKEKITKSFGSKSDKHVIPSPVEEDSMINDVNVKPQSATSFRDLGSKEEAFFDSQGWLESDCEDDFLSVKGDFTPSRGSTPVHHNFSTGNRTLNSTSKPEPEKKKLSDLFKESLRVDHDVDETKAKSTNTSPFASRANSVRSSERTPNGQMKLGREKSIRSAQCCLPSLLSSRSFIERKKLSPTRNVA